MVSFNSPYRKGVVTELEAGRYFRGKVVPVWGETGEGFNQGGLAQGRVSPGEGRGTADACSTFW